MTPSSYSPSSSHSHHSPLPPVNFTGRWVLDPSVSDSLGSLMAYHGLRDESLISLAESLIPTLLISHDQKKIRTQIFTSAQLSEFASASGQSLTPSATEEYEIDGKYHVVQLTRGLVQSRCYLAPHGQSVVVDTRCNNKYDLERSERFCLENGNIMILEIRILTCDPARSVRENAIQSSGGQQGNHNNNNNNKTKNNERSSSSSSSSSFGVATPFSTVFNKPVVAGNNVIVNELLFCKRVFRRIHSDSQGIGMNNIIQIQKSILAGNPNNQNGGEGKGGETAPPALSDPSSGASPSSSSSFLSSTSNKEIISAISSSSSSSSSLSSTSLFLVRPVSPFPVQTFIPPIFLLALKGRDKAKIFIDILFVIFVIVLVILFADFSFPSISLWSFSLHDNWIGQWGSIDVAKKLLAPFDFVMKWIKGN